MMDESGDLIPVNESSRQWLMLGKFHRPQLPANGPTKLEPLLGAEQMTDIEG
jgi:hypothetical protein